MGIFGGVEEKEKINSTTPCGFRKYFLSFSNFRWKRGLFWIFIGLLWSLKIVWESQMVYLGGSKKRKKSIWPLLMALKNVFWVFPIFGKKGVFFIFIGLFWNLRIVLESQLAYLGGSKNRKKSIWPLIMALKNVFWVFPFFDEKGVFFGFLLEFFKT